MNHGHAEQFRTLMQSYFDDMKALALAAKAVGLSRLPVKEQNSILFGLIEVMVHTGEEAGKDMAFDDRTMARPFNLVNGGRA